MATPNPNDPLLVLVADDFDDSAQLLAQLLESTTPYAGLWAKDGESAYDLTLVRRPFACLLDISMP